ncbi:hypothetical protein [Peptostreptococcus canis]|uniref:Phage protein n=1 Tax=Peptostreptococcus canis TaxID=1159213 RepID=A0ABR6TIH0_9FIRM|nr:hypothetical protein [Peptostreptococcus canis]MBC2575218.1 hypothetical protein [Peptostreptococcus canis]MBP1997605.1 hypothetical protein [Peptostreptococcus canis]
MIELVIKKYLDENLKIPVFMEHQNKEPKRFVIFEKTGSSKRNRTYAATFVFQSYAESMYEAAKLNEEVKKIVENMVMLDEVAFVKLNTDYNFTDTETKKYRYQAVFDIKHY